MTPAERDDVRQVAHRLLAIAERRATSSVPKWATVAPATTSKRIDVIVDRSLTVEEARHLATAINAAADAAEEK